MTARQAVQFVELDISWCSLSYGEGACPAVLGVDSDEKCFNTRATCPVIASYATSTVTLRFGEATAMPVLTIEAIPNLSGVSFTPAKINPGEDLGERANLRVSLGEHPHSDTGDGFDKYHDERAYNPFEQGTMWGKFRARQPWLRGQAVRWYLGYADQALEEMECRYFIVESFDGPNVEGIYTLVAVDPLKMLDGDRAQAPFVSGGRLNAGIDDAVTAANLTPSGIGDADYPASGHLALGGNEIVSFTRTADALSIDRAELGTPASDHDAADRAQLVLRYVSEDPADIIYDLMVNYAGVPAGYIPLAEWQAETATYLRRNYTASIAEPTPVAQLVAELMQQCGLSIWWDDLSGQIRLRVLRGLSTATVTFSDENVLRGTFQRREQPGKRVSQVWTFYGQRNPLTGQEDADNYRSVAVVADLDNEANYGSPAIRKIYSRWIAGGGLTAAQRVGDLLIGRYGTPPRAFSFSVMRDAQANPVLGAGYVTTWRTEQLADGSPESVSGQAIRVTPAKDRMAVELEESRFDNLDDDDLTTRTITVNYDDLDLNIRSMHDELYPEPTFGTVVRFVVEAGVYVGASLTSIPAIQTGSWPTQAVTGNRTSGSPILSGLSVDTATWAAVGQRVSGTGIPAGAKILSIDSTSQITLDMNASSGAGTSTALTVAIVLLEIVIRGNVFGRGGKGGQGANGNGDVDGEDGYPGGPALLLEYPCDLTDEDGILAGGGGGGGGGPCRDPNDHKGGGGGGGQGELGGDGGIGPGSAGEGLPGSRDAAGTGGRGWTNNTIFQGPSSDGTRRGGDGGALGEAGQDGQGSSDLDKGDGGDPGASIDGVSNALTIGIAGDRRGPQIN